ncbi:M55 family metallopeptidase [Nocardioides panacihumi]|uniref:M55 family metallopeptidase n=1 Tax=Nocardioides panacihumi TaxID=400774 RepID=A0ABN2RUA2_9ACTN
MKVYISVDMEGIGGVATLDQTVRGGHGYPRAQQLMTQETNAAIDGAFAGGATDVLVSDSHGTMDNLIHEQLDPRARLIFGTPRGFCMAEGLTDDFDLALFVGYHAPAGAVGVLAHTFSSHFTAVRVNGHDASEASVNALFAATRGVPVGLVTGDDVICALAEASLPGVSTVAVKRSIGFSSAESMPPSLACEAVRAGARSAVERSDPRKLLSIPSRLHVEFEMPNATAAELASGIPGVVRSGDRTVGREVDSADELLGLVTVAYSLAHLGVVTRLGLLERR